MKVDTSALFLDILAFDGNRHRANHLLKVTSYAVLIGRREGMTNDELERLRLAGMLHDIGIKTSRERHGSSAGEFQQREGPPLARAMLEKYGYPAADIDRVCYLIAHHHDYDNIEGLDYQILVEADFLVNCDEKGMAKEQVAEVRRKIFRTGTGSGILDALFEI